jgi:hypothetical protein
LHHLDALLLGNGRLGGRGRQACLLHLHCGHGEGSVGVSCSLLKRAA